MYYKNHPIKWIRITGVIVAVDDFTTRRIYTVDDSSGMCIECTSPAPPPTPLILENPTSYLTGQPLPKPAPAPKPQSKAKDKDEPPSTDKPSIPEGLDVGAVVKIKGKPSTFRDMKQIAIIKAEVIRGTEKEVRCWDEVMAWSSGVLGQPWEVSAEQEDRCRRKALGKRKGESEEARRKRKDAERLKRHNDKRRKKEPGMEIEGEKQTQRRREDIKPAASETENGMQYPSLAAKRALKGKYDALGI